MSYQETSSKRFYRYVGAATTSYAVALDDEIVAFGFTAGSNFAVMLPDAAQNKFRLITLRLSADNNVTLEISIMSAGGFVENPIDGFFGPGPGTNVSTAVPGPPKITQITRSLTYSSDGVNWQIISAYNAIGVRNYSNNSAAVGDNTLPVGAPYTVIIGGFKQIFIK